MQLVWWTRRFVTVSLASCMLNVFGVRNTDNSSRRWHKGMIHLLLITLFARFLFFFCLDRCCPFVFSIHPAKRFKMQCEKVRRKWKGHYEGCNYMMCYLGLKIFTMNHNAAHTPACLSRMANEEDSEIWLLGIIQTGDSTACHQDNIH